MQKKGRALRSKIAQSFLSLLSWSVVSHCSLLCHSGADLLSGLFFVPKEIPPQALKSSQELPTNCPARWRTHKRCTFTVDFMFSVPVFHHITMNGPAIQTVTGED